MVKPNWIIAIDPGVNKSGVVLLDVKNKEFVFAAALSFAHTMYSINMMLVDISAKDCVVVVIEDSDMSANWHYSQKDSKAKVAAKGRSVGMCHATARHLKEYCEWQQSISSTVMMKPIEIANLINRDRTTVMYLLKVYKDEIKYNPYFKELAKGVDDKMIKQENQ